jgi:hypothetical protein
MRIVIKLLVVVAMLATTHSAWASYTFTMNLDISGSCGGLSIVERRAAQALFDRYANSVNLGIPSRAECEQARQIIMSEINGIGSGSCKIRVVCGPCTGSGGMGDAPGVNLEGPSKGGSFYSGNASSEIRDWDQQNNALKQMLSGNSTNAVPQNTWTASVYKNADSWIANGKSSQEKEFASNAKSSRANGFVIDNSKPFVSLNDRPISYGEMMPIAQKPDLEDSRLNTLLMLGASYKDIEEDIYKMFYEQAGCTKELLAEIEKKPESERTENEQQLLENYYEFKDKCYDYMRKSALEDEGKREVDAAVLSYAAYYDTEYKNKKGDVDKMLSQIGYERLDVSKMSLDDPFYDVVKLVLQHNIDGVGDDGSGFRAQIFKNKETGEYTIAFEGTDDMFNLASVIGSKDRWTDIKAGVLDFDTKQFQAALEIGQAIANLPEGCNVNITGHSLGGALASIAGLVSGSPTITVNAMGVPNDWLERNGLSEKYANHDYNIKALISADDVLNQLQSLTENPNTRNALLGPGSALGDQKILGKSTVVNAITEYSKATIQTLDNAAKQALSEAVSGAVQSGIIAAYTTGPAGIIPAAAGGAAEGAIKGAATAAIEGNYKLIAQELNDPKILKTTGVSWHGSEGVAQYVLTNNNKSVVKWNNWHSIEKQKKDAEKKKNKKNK